MKKIALVNQRYGLEVNGGSEYYTRLIAERLAENYEVEILTTCALNYTTWENHYPEGVEKVNGIPVRRFRVEKERNQDRFAKLTAQAVSQPGRTRAQENIWIDEQGPYAPGLIDYIGEHQEDYDVFFFVTYLYYSTVRGILRAPEKAVLIPTAHDEPYIHFEIYQDVFRLPKAIVFLTDEEKELVHGMFHNEDIPYEVMGVGVDIPEQIDAERFKKKYGLDEYIIYVGRVEESKGCDWLFKYFIEYKKEYPESPLKLVLMGKAVMKIPTHPDIISLGFVSDEDKYDGIAGSRSLMLPSPFESLSISVLEAMTLGVPVIVNGRCEVLKGHCIKSNAGFFYYDYVEFREFLNYLLNHPNDYEAMSANGKRYVHENYRWNVIMEKFGRLIDTVIQ